MYDVFISVNHSDLEIGEKITDALKIEYGIECWIYSQQTKGGDSYRQIIPGIIDKSKACVFIQSINSMNSKEILSEVELAYNADKPMICYKLDNHNSPFSYQFAGKVFIDATTRNLNECIFDLASSLCKILDRPCQKTQVAVQSTCFTDYKIKSTIPSCSRFFFGRQSIMSQIHSLMRDSNRILFLRGMSGIGTSEIAKQFANQYSTEYSTIVYIKYLGDLARSIADDSIVTISTVSRRIKTDTDEPQTDQEYAEEKIKLLQEYCDEKTLIIIDDYDVTNDPIFDILTSDGRYRVLITTQCDQDRGRFAIIPVHEIPDDSSLKNLVLSYCDGEYLSLDAEDPLFDELFSLTRRHTLTLEIISKYMVENSIELDEMIVMLKSVGFASMTEHSIMHNGCESDGYSILKETFRFSSLTDDDKSFFRYLCLMPSYGIDQRYFKKWCDSSIYGKCRTRLLKRSLIKYDAKTNILSIHPLIREIAIEELTPQYDNCKYFLDKLKADLFDYISWNYPLNQKQIYLDCCKSIKAQISEPDRDSFDLHFHMANFSCFIDDIKNCIPVLNQLLDKADCLFGDGSPQSAKILHRIAWCHYVYKDISKALDIYENHALPALSQNIQDVPGEYIHCCCDMARIYYFYLKQSEGLDKKKNKAKELLKSSYDIITDEAFLSKYEIVKYRAMLFYNTVSKLFVLSGDNAAAYKYAYMANKRASELPYTEMDQSSIRALIAKIHIANGDYDKAKDELIIAIDTMTSVSGMLEFSCSQSERFLSLHTDIAECYEKSGDLENSKKHLAEAVRIAGQIYAPEHDEYIRIANKYFDC